MTSLTRIAHGSRVFLHGRSRWPASYQARSARTSTRRTLTRVDVGAGDAHDAPPRPERPPAPTPEEEVGERKRGGRARAQPLLVAARADDDHDRGSRGVVVPQPAACPPRPPHLALSLEH